MSLAQDLELILESVLPVDPSFRRVEKGMLDRCIDRAKKDALAGSRDGFLMSTMRLLALPGNGHTRLIPNDAVKVLPLRFVTLGEKVQLCPLSDTFNEETGGELLAVNGVPVARIETAAASYLAGTAQRRRVIGPLLLAWPFALKRLGFAADTDETEYRVLADGGQVIDLKLANENSVPASHMYPRNDHGRPDPAWQPTQFAEVTECLGFGVVITLPSFFALDKASLSKAMENAAKHVENHSKVAVLLDLRGNTGGDFLTSLPLIDALSRSARPRRVAALVDKFTFSAAIVFVAILKFRLGDRLTIIGEEMGDGSKFFAEGGLIDLPTTGALVRYSTAFHDWESGTTDLTTPPEIARHVVPAGKLDIERAWVARPDHSLSRAELYQEILDMLIS